MGRRILGATLCVTPSVLYTKVNAECDKMATVLRSSVILSWHYLRRSTCRGEFFYMQSLRQNFSGNWENALILEISEYPYHTVRDTSGEVSCQTLSSIYPAVSTKHRLMTDEHQQRYRQTDRQRAIANTALAYHIISVIYSAPTTKWT